MTGSDERGQYGPIPPWAEEPLHRLPFVISDLSATGIVIICELDEPNPQSSERSLNMKMTQYLRLSDGSMIRLDMDRGLSSFQHGGTEPISWKQSAADVISEVLTLIQADAVESDVFPWDLYAEAAQLRGLSVEAEALHDLPCTVLLSDQLAAIYEF